MEKAQHLLRKEDFIRLFTSPEMWQVPIESFIEVYCLIFTPEVEDANKEDQSGELKTARQGDIAERIRIFNDYKKLISEILTGTILRKKVSRQQLFQTLAELVAEDDYAMLQNRHVMESLKYLLAVEDFKVFTTFMEDMNIILNDQTAQQLEGLRREQDERRREDALRMLKIKQREQQQRGETPRDLKEEMALVLQMSLAEEEDRKLALLSLQEQEDEELRIALEASLKLSESPILVNALEQVTQRSARRHIALLTARKLASETSSFSPDKNQSMSTSDLIQKVTSIQPSETSTHFDNFSILKVETEPLVKLDEEQKQSRAVQEFRISKKNQKGPSKKQHHQVVEATLFETVETLEERRARLRATRNALQASKHQEVEAPVINNQQQRTKEEQERLQRCLKVLREAADEVFGQSQPKETKTELKPEISDTGDSRLKESRIFNQSAKGLMLNANEDEGIVFQKGKDTSFDFK